MNMIMKAAVGAAIAVAASSAANASMGDIWSGNSDLVLWVQAVNGSGTPVGSAYAFDTGETVSAAFGTSFTPSAAGNLTALPGFSQTYGSIGSGNSTGTLTSFMSSALSAGDSVSWAVEGGFYTGTQAVGAINGNTKTTGAAEAIFTSSYAPLSSPNGVTTLVGNSLNQLLNGFAAGGATPPTGAGALENLVTPFGSQNTTTSVAWTGGDQAHFGIFGNGGAADSWTALGTAESLYGVTGNSPGSSAGSALLQDYTLGTVSLSSAGVLTFAGSGGSQVPLPAGLWLLGSGLLGLLGVSRRKVAA
jgi:hypothetical protein